MPLGSKVDNAFQAMKAKGIPAGEAAAIAQKQTGQALRTGKPFAKKSAKKTRAKSSVRGMRGASSNFAKVFE